MLIHLESFSTMKELSETTTTNESKTTKSEISQSFIKKKMETNRCHEMKSERARSMETMIKFSVEKIFLRDFLFELFRMTRDGKRGKKWRNLISVQLLMDVDVAFCREFTKWRKTREKKFKWLMNLTKNFIVQQLFTILIVERVSVSVIQPWMKRELIVFTSHDCYSSLNWLPTALLFWFFQISMQMRVEWM